MVKDSTKLLVWLVVIAAIVLAGMLLEGCGTVTPPVAAPTAAVIDWDGVYHDAGIVRIECDKQGHQIGLIVTEYWLAKYQTLVAIYGDQLVPTLTKDNAGAGMVQRPNDPVRGPVFVVPNSAQDAMRRMVAKYKATQKP